MMWEEEFRRNRLAAQQIMGTTLVLTDESAAGRAHAAWAQTPDNTRPSRQAVQRDKDRLETNPLRESKGPDSGGGNLWGEWRRLRDLSDALEYDTLRYSRFFEEQTE